VIGFLSDFGLDDGYVGVVKGVMLGIDPTVQIVDLSHTVPAQDVRAGAFVLMTAVSYFPTGTVFLAVVDPGVGTTRPAVAVEVGGYRFVGPDNGLLSWALRRLGCPAQADGPCDGAAPARNVGEHLRLGAVGRAVTLAERRFWRPTVSSTFHGRDLFGPVAAHLARGVPLAELGEPVDEIGALPFPRPIRGDDDRVLRGEVIYVDRFGNLITNLEPADVPSGSTVRIGGRVIAGLAPHFQQESELIALVGSSGLIEVAVPNGSAAAALGLGVGAVVLAG
jgi:S-adenosylmethionine hydrolase